MESENFVLCLVSVCQEDRPNLHLEYRTDWTDLMQLVLMVLETFPHSVKRVQTMARLEMEAWSAGRCRLVCGESESGQKEGSSNSMAGRHKHSVQASVRLTERDFYCGERGTTKHLCLLLSHGEVITEIVLDVRRKVRIRSLVELAAAQVAAGVSLVSQIVHLPEQVGWAVRREICDDWTPAYFDRNFVQPIAALGNLPPPLASSGGQGGAPPPPMVVMEVAAANKRRNLSGLTVCPYCKRSGLKNVRLHVIKRKLCRESWEKDDNSA
jgi:hypothetical protein